MTTTKALFLDRDGIINEDVHYPHKPEHIRFCKGIFDLCKSAVQKGYLLIVVTNQAGVAKGLFTEDEVKLLHGWMAAQFKAQGITITGFYYCPYHKRGTVPAYTLDSDWRKPEPGMFIKAAADHAIDFSKSLMVGDKESDRIRLPDLRSIIVKSEYVPENYDVATLGEVAELL